MYVGQAEETVRNLFKKARLNAPCILFLDEIDAIVSKRGLAGEGGQGDSVQERVLATLLNEMDGIESSPHVIVVGATNRVDMLDDALLRPGRFGEIVHIPYPDEQTREEILLGATKGVPIAEDISMREWAACTEGFSGADLDNLCREAALCAMRENINSLHVRNDHFKKAFQSLSRKVESRVGEGIGNEDARHIRL
tara:strand:+ start:77 stop:664 length:588 start_codon:yes stop_codon:yes gene_type:complete